MCTEMLTPDHSPPGFPSPAQHQHTTKSHRVLACVTCQLRKVKCDRQTPCSNCTKAGIQCVSAALVPRQRRRRFAEKDLLDRLRHYERLLHQNNIPFEPLHPEAATDRMVKNSEADLPSAMRQASLVGSQSIEDQAMPKAQYVLHIATRCCKTSFAIRSASLQRRGALPAFYVVIVEPEDYLRCSGCFAHLKLIAHELLQRLVLLCFTYD
jgi:hypothetical protein